MKKRLAEILRGCANRLHTPPKPITPPTKMVDVAQRYIISKEELMINESCAINADELIEGAKRRYIEEYKERITKGILLAIRQGELIRFTTEGNMRGEIIIEGRLTVKTNQ